MSTNLLSSIGPVLAAPWRQRRNIGSLWGVAAVVFMVFLGPLATCCWGLYERLGSGAATPDALAASALVADQLLRSAANFAVVGLAILVLGWWALFVSNVLEQNRPVLARLVPHHPARLRTAMAVAWAGCTALMAALVGGRFGAPLVWVATAGAVLALVAVSLRWPLLWLSGIAMPLVVSEFQRWPGRAAFVDGVVAQWTAQPVSITLTLAAACVVTLAALIQSGGHRHVASDAVRIARVQRFQARARGMQPTWSDGGRCRLDALFAQPYFGWWRHLMARRGAPVVSRLMLGLGPAMHWTASATAVVVSLAVIAAVFGLGEALRPIFPWLRDFVDGMSVGMAIGLVPGVTLSALKARTLLIQTRGEQGLLALLPGVPRGPALTRTLALRLTLQFVLTLVGGCLIQWLCLAEARTVSTELAFGGFAPVLGRWILIGMVPTLAFQWRNWARVSGAAGLVNLVPLLLAGVVVALVGAVTRLGLCTEPVAALIVVALTVGWCAMRWQRMGREPASMPAGRLA